MQHSKLCLARPADAFAESTTHPADHARMMLMRAVLTRCGPTSAAELAQSDPTWSAYIADYAAQGIVPPPDFDVRYPATLVDQLADFAVDLFSVSGVRRFDGPACSPPDLPGLLRSAWTTHAGDIPGYADWERQTLAALWPQLAPPRSSVRSLVAKVRSIFRV
jgi:hypothetical protein